MKYFQVSIANTLSNHGYICFKLNTDNWNEVQYPYKRAVIDDCIQDIHDGEHYKKLSEQGKFFSAPERTGLILCSDGVPLFKSSGIVV